MEHSTATAWANYEQAFPSNRARPSYADSHASSYFIRKNGRLVAQYLNEPNDLKAIEYILTESKLDFKDAIAAGYELETRNDSTGESSFIKA